MTGMLGSERHNTKPRVRCPRVCGALASLVVVGLLTAGCGSGGHSSASTAAALPSATTPARTATTPATAGRRHAAQATHATHATHGVPLRQALLPHSLGGASASRGARLREMRAARAAYAAELAAAGKPGSKFCKLNVGGRTILVSCQREAEVLAQDRKSEQTARALGAGRQHH